MKKVLLMVSTLLMMVSCTKMVNLNLEENSAKTMAERYFFTLEQKSNLFPGRAVDGTYPALIYYEEIYDENNNLVFFEDFSEDYKKEFYKTWKEDYINQLIEKFESDESLILGTLIEVEAYEKTVSNLGRKINSCSVEEFSDIYLKTYEKVLNKYKKNFEISRNSSSSSSGSGKITENCIVKSSLDIYKKYNKKGRVLVNSGDSGSFLYVGHTSMMYHSYDDIWIKNGLSKSAITSYPKKEVWPDQEDGVQYEPIGYWCGNASGSAKNVSIYEVQSVYWEKLKKKTKIATDNEYKKATDFADTKIGCSYTTNFIADKDSTKRYYCSSLVWQALKYANDDFDISPIGLWIAPMDIANSNKTKKLLSYTNK